MLSGAFSARYHAPGRPGDCHRLTIWVFAVRFQVLFASVLGAWHGPDFTRQFLPDDLPAFCRNLVMALPVQLFLVGPRARWIFRSLFQRDAHSAEA